MSSDVVIRVNNLGKCYHMYEKPRDRLLQGIMPRIQRLAGQQAKQYFREFWALQDITFEILRGETVGIIGKNGSGKSTLLQMLCGTLTPTAGDVEVRGRVAALLELGAGFNPEFTGKENVYMNASILGLTKEQIDARLDQILAFADIGDFINQPVKTYSSGMFVRLAFAVIAHVDADVLIIDEALAVGDAFFTQKCMRFLRSFQEQGTILFVSHDSAAVINLCQRAIWLDHGHVVAVGETKTVCEAYLEDFYRVQAGEPEKSKPHQQASITAAIQEDAPQQDPRWDTINYSTLRNDLQVFTFQADSTAAFGQSGARITDVTLLDRAGKQLTSILGGETVTLKIGMHCLQTLTKPIVGFIFKDRLGQYLFGDNTYLSYLDEFPIFAAGTDAEASFTFQMPLLPAGDYAVTVAIAEGEQHDHIQHHWLHEALIVRSLSSSVSTGLVGIPMQAIRLESSGRLSVP
jgi:lipopolysaccharide transport system ATP-binding protein